MTFLSSPHKTLYILIGLLLVILPPSILTARIFLATEIVSGQVISIMEEGIIEMDDGFRYYPGTKKVPLSIKSGEYISIKYYFYGNDERKYIEYAPGKNSLKPTPVPEIKTMQKDRL